MKTAKASFNGDRRVIRTKKTLEDTLLSLIKEKNTDKITVRELTAAANVNRSTFYFYYDSIGDMLEKLQADVYARFEEQVLSENSDLREISDLTRYFTVLLRFIRENSEICCLAVENGVFSPLFEKTRRVLLESIPDTRDAFALTDPRHYVTVYTASGTWAAITAWMRDGMSIPVGDFALCLAKMFFFGGRAIVLGE